MAFSPVLLPIEEILLTHFITDIALITNANVTILQDKLEDLINGFEMDIATMSIGTDSPINYIRTKSVIMDDTGFIFQTGTPSVIIASLSKNGNLESVLNIDHLTSDILIDGEAADINDLLVNVLMTSTGPAVFNNSTTQNAAVITSKETVITDATLIGGFAEARITLTSGSNKNIFVKINAITAPAAGFVYNGGVFAGVAQFHLYIDFDAVSPPVQNTEFKIYIVDIIESVGNTSIMSDIAAQTMQVVIKPGTNLSALPAPTTIILHNGLGSGLEVGLNPQSITPDGSAVLQSNIPSAFGHNISLFYMIDENLNDRLIINAMVGLEFF